MYERELGEHEPEISIQLIYDLAEVVGFPITFGALKMRTFWSLFLWESYENDCFRVA